MGSDYAVSIVQFVMATDVILPRLLIGSNVWRFQIPEIRGEFSKLTGAIGAQGWGIVASGGVPDRKDPNMWNAVIKIQEDVTEAQIREIIGQLEGHQILDIREM